MTILTVVDMQNLYARVDIDETLIDNVALNSKAVIRTEGTTDRRFNGTVYEIGRYAAVCNPERRNQGKTGY